MNNVLILLSVAMTTAISLSSRMKYEVDTLPTKEGNLEITFFGHSSLMFQFKGKFVYVDPVSQYADFSKLPKADLILVTHEHGDHFDNAAIGKIRTAGTKLVYTKTCEEKLPGGLVMKNGDMQVAMGIKMEAVPAYNLVHMRSIGVPFHPKGSGNGYVITFGDKRIYVAGDTENIPEMSKLGTIDYAFLPMNIPYTMTPEMVAEAAKRIKPKILYPYHFGNTDTARLVNLLKDDKGIEVRIRKMQ
jgi:L-ascorbate metabolism protein UlaG (beta-lactamase superfamily)